ncbi:MAG: lytic transglycosylase domain-containing protein [Zoogloeaceae bacterium]|jgi:soluble lytic murein transglycosylase|nr:lytic transglycosylase domain-containing protein [Zoogloeaceae bacterium]
MKWLFLLGGLLLPGMPTQGAPARLADTAAAAVAQEEEALPEGDRLFLEAREAFRTGKREKLAALAQALRAEAHVLADYADYYLLSLDPQKERIQGFLERQGKSYLGERLRSEQFKTLARQKEWREAGAAYAALLAPDQEARCFHLLTRIRLRPMTSLGDGRTQWLTLTDQSGGCRALMAEVEGWMSIDQRWARIRLMFELNRLPQARQMLKDLPVALRPDPKELERMIDKPAAWITRMTSERMQSRVNRELLALAIQRMARNDPAFAVQQMERWAQHLGEVERAWAWGQLGLQGALRHMEKASLWFGRSRPGALSADALEWRVRVALRQKNWKAVHENIRSMPEALREKPEWLYWEGRAEKALGKKDAAVRLFARIAGQHHFYGNLADEELGRGIRVPPPSPPLEAREIAAARANPGLNRALAFFRLDLRIEGIREWNWAVRDLTDRELLAAAEFAREHQIYDRAIQAAERTREQHDFRLRFLSPFLEDVRPAAREQALDDAWVYGLIRQESRFVIAAKSSAGASGLMQLMPATARWVARKIGLKDYDPKRVTDPNINLRLGTSYMRMVLEALDQHPVLASAAYNAGPGRARRWKAGVPLEGAIYAETIPFNETRDYVKKVMSNTVYYALLFNGNSEPVSLYARLGTIPAQNAGEKPIPLP